MKGQHFCLVNLMVVHTNMRVVHTNMRVAHTNTTVVHAVYCVKSVLQKVMVVKSEII